jgi:hypothetical protein
MDRLKRNRKQINLQQFDRLLGVCYTTKRKIQMLRNLIKTHNKSLHQTAKKPAAGEFSRYMAGLM